jgi:predicted small lipoprotein YifL
MPTRTLIALLVVAAALSGCGRRGPLEPPPRAGAVSSEPAIPSARPEGVSPLDPGSSPDDSIIPREQNANREPGAPAAPKKHFFLDFLL